MLKYLRYFWYLAINWNFRVALRMIVNEVKGEKKYGIATTGADELVELEESGVDTSHATIYMPADYGLLEKIFNEIDLGDFSHFIDIGCGKGRVMCVAAHSGAAKITGVELSPDLAKCATENIAITQQQIPEATFSIVNNDAFYFDFPADADCIFLFNPFDEIVLEQVLKNINKSYRKHPRKITLVYFSLLYEDLLVGAGFVETKYFKEYKYLQASVFEKA